MTQFGTFQIVINLTHKREFGTIVLVWCIKYHVVDMTLDAPKISH